MEFLHKIEPPILFRNLKPAAVFVDNEFKVRLTDLGNAKVMEQVAETFNVVVSSNQSDGRYQPPELFINNKGDKASDVWSFGLILNEMLTG